MPEILFADVDSASVEDAVIRAYEQIAQITLYPGDPVRLFLESIAYTLARQNNVINLAGRQNLLAYATGSHLDYIASTANITASLLGSDVEDDERYRARIRQAPEAFSCAGPKGAYEYYALAAHPSRAGHHSPAPGISPGARRRQAHQS